MFGETRNEYVTRKTDDFRTSYTRTRQQEGLPIDNDQLRHHLQEIRSIATDWYDFWDSVTPW